jgi:SAM-dependent methyltransferase
MNGDTKVREREFHNDRFGRETDPRAQLGKWYGAVRHGAEIQDSLVRERARGATVLEYGCADGALSVDFLDIPSYCDSFTGIDISDVAIQKATNKAAHLGYRNSRFLAMDAESMTFPDETFDLVFGRGIVHHLDTARALGEVSRVLKKDGAAVFFEPLGHNPMLNLYRSRTPTMRTPDEHPLLLSDFALAKKYFARLETTFFGLFSVASVIFDATASGTVYRIARAIDDRILKSAAVGRYAWYALMVCHKA